MAKILIHAAAVLIATAVAPSLNAAGRIDAIIQRATDSDIGKP